eukprot:s3_g31.t1
MSSKNQIVIESYFASSESLNGTGERDIALLNVSIDSRSLCRETAEYLSPSKNRKRLRSILRRYALLITFQDVAELRGPWRTVNAPAPPIPSIPAIATKASRWTAGANTARAAVVSTAVSQPVPRRPSMAPSGMCPRIDDLISVSFSAHLCLACFCSKTAATPAVKAAFGATRSAKFTCCGRE